MEMDKLEFDIDKLPIFMDLTTWLEYRKMGVELIDTYTEFEEETKKAAL